MASSPTPARKRYVPAVGPRLQILLRIVLGLFALLAVNGIYLGTVTLAEWRSGETYQNYFYQLMFLGHLVLGLALVLPLIVFGVAHIVNAHGRSNRRAVRVGYGLFVASLVVVVSGVVLTRLEGVLEVKDPATRSVAYWAHIVSPVVVVWLYILHRLAGPRIRWKVGLRWAAVAGVFAVAMLSSHTQDPRQWNVAGPEEGEQYFFPSLARTSTGDFIPADVLQKDDYCLECHADVHEQWSRSMHKFASFNNPVYLASVRETRQVAFERDGSVQAARFCAGCHDPVPFFSGAFDDPDFDDVNDPTSQAGVTCTVCHAITHVNSVRGNADYTIEEPIHYPFVDSENPLLAWINRQLVKAKPAFHKKVFLKPLHTSAEYCGACHKVHLPVELNGYKWLRGQNHYDAWRLSGVSGRGVTSWYYPPEAEPNCNNCHMEAVASDDFGAKDLAGDGVLAVHDHQFPSANTAIPHMLGLGQEAIEAHERFTEGTLRVDLFGLKRGGTIDGELIAPLRPEAPGLVPGERYLLEAVVRTVSMGHTFTQGTSDSNEVWLDVTLRDGDRIIGRSGARAPEGDVDPWSHFVNSYIIDREGGRIERRNPQDIFVSLYNHQIPPGAADVVHYAFNVPEDAVGPITVEAALRFRKFDSRLMRFVLGEDYVGNDLPIMTIASDRLSLPVEGAGAAAGAVANGASEIPEWQRWNDYGIGLFRKGEAGSNRGELRQAEEAFARVEALGRPDGPLNRARVYLKEGRVDEAAGALNRAAVHDPPAPPWSLAWFNAEVNDQNGYLDEAIAGLTELLAMDTEETRARGFDFAGDDRVHVRLGQALFERSKLERGEAGQAARTALLDRAAESFARALVLDPESVPAHYGMSLVEDERGDAQAAERHRRLHAKYKPDDNARDRAVAIARQADPAANHAAEAVVIYDLQRPGAYGLEGDERGTDEEEGTR